MRQGCMQLARPAVPCSPRPHLSWLASHLAYGRHTSCLHSGCACSSRNASSHFSASTYSWIRPWGCGWERQ